MILLAFLAFAGWFTAGTLCADQKFLNPPPFGEIMDFKQNPTYTETSVLNVVWTEGEAGKKCSLVLYQVNRTDPSKLGEEEVLTRDAVDITSYSWLVGTDKDLDESDVFFLSYYQEGKTDPNMNSHYFNIKKRDGRPTPTTANFPGSTPSAILNPPNPQNPQIPSGSDSPSATSRKSPSNSATISQLPTSSPTSPTNSTSTFDNQSSTPTSSTQPSLSPSGVPPISPDPPIITITAVIGICVGVLVALIILLVAAFLWIRRHRRKRTAKEDKLAESDQEDDGYSRPDLPEAPEKSPKEMGQREGLWTTKVELAPRSPGELGPNENPWTGRPEVQGEDSRFELPQNSIWAERSELPMRSPAELGQNGNLWTGRPELPHTVRYELYGSSP